MTDFFTNLHSVYSENHTKQEVNSWPLVKPFVTPLETMSTTFEPLSNIVHTPNFFLQEALGLPFEDCLNISTMFLWISLCFAFSQVSGPIQRRLFSSCCGLFIGFYFFGVSYWVNIALIFCVSLILSIPMPDRKWNAYLATFTAIAFLMSRAIYEQLWSCEGLTIKNLICQMTLNVHMYSVNFMDSQALLDERKDPRKAKHLTWRERDNAESLIWGFNFVDFFGYMTFVSACIIGMAHEYSDFVDLMDLKGRYRSMPRKGQPHLLQTLKRFG